MSTPRKLVIVESPTKAKTIASYLGDGFDVHASVGHIRDLPQPSELPASMKKGPFGRFAVNVEDHFQPYYVVEPSKKAKVKELKEALAGADELYLATDEDREGEAIAWHLLQVLKPKVPVKRMVFHEITKPAIREALAHPRDLDIDLVDAQETRRILDRLYGYEISPVLWRKVKAGLSAGRVQSVATRLVVERERERMAFTAAQYWDITGRFAPAQGTADAGSAFAAHLTQVDGQRVATGRDFDDAGQLRTKGAVALGETAVRELAAALAAAAFQVTDLQTKPYKRRPAAPFTTSTLQQEASRKLRMNSRQTMRVAQRLYENGYITYMRTDSVHLSEQALAAARTEAAHRYGTEAVPAEPRRYATTSKGAQEAHEAIRPAGDAFRAPSDLAGRLAPEELKLYELIWRRTVASQMTDATGQTATVTLGARAGGKDVAFSAAGTVITHRGFLAVYEEGRDQARYAEAAERKDERLPEMTVGQALTARELEPEKHETTPPPRYTEASLVAALEKRGIGRPSTYASIMSVIEDRGYVERHGQALQPTWLAFAVTQLLEQHFGDLVDYDFTAAMESGLDQIALGKEQREEWLHDFYYGHGDAARAAGHPASDPSENAAGRLAELGLKRLVADQGDIDARKVNTVPLGEGVALRVGRYGPYVEMAAATEGESPRRASVPPELAPDELTPARAKALIEQAQAGGQARELGADPATGHQIVVKDGRYGPYVQEVLPTTPGQDTASGKKTKAKAPKPRSASLFKSMKPDTVTLEDALKLLSLPRVVGADPTTGEDITAQNGRFGPYLKRGTDSRSLQSEEQLFTVTLEEALALYAQPKTRRGQARAQAAPLAELGQDPATGKNVVVKDGRWGPYVTDGETNATLPRGEEPAGVTLERAAELLAAKRARGPVKRRSTRKPAAKKPAAKSKSAAKKK